MKIVQTDHRSIVRCGDHRHSAGLFGARALGTVPRCQPSKDGTAWNYSV